LSRSPAENNMPPIASKTPIVRGAMPQSSPNEAMLLFLSAVLGLALCVFIAPKAYGQGNTPGAVQNSLRYLSGVMDACHDRFWVYEDVSSPCNHFHAYGKLPDASSPITIEGSWAQNPARGATALRITHPGGGPSYPGWYLMNGVLQGSDTAPSTNFGTIPNAGVDLRGATRIVFWARSDTEGALADFFMGGVGRDALDGCPVSAYPDSTPRIPEAGKHFVLHTTWTKYEIPLVRRTTTSACEPADIDLSYVLGGFGVVLPSFAPLTVYLDDIYYEFDAEHRAQRLAQPRFLRSFTTLPLQPNITDSNKDDDIDLVLRSTAFSYDNAVTILAYLAEGSTDSLRRARLIGDAFVYAANHDRTFTDGRARIAYGAGDIALPHGWEPKGIPGTTPVAGFYTEPQTFLEVQQQATDTGVNSWVGIAMLSLYYQSGDPKYLAHAKTIASFIYMNFLNTTGTYKGFLAGFQNPESSTPQLRMYASTEHNEDMIAFARRLYAVTGASEHQFAAQHAKDFVNAMWEDSLHCFFAGTTNPSQRNEAIGQLPLDIHPWAVLAASEIFNEKPQVLACPEQFHKNTSSGLTAYDFNDDKDGVWFEGTAQMAVAHKMTGNLAQWSNLLAVLQTARNTPPTGDTFGIAAATPDGITTGFMETDETPIKYYRRLHIAATGWHVLAELGQNPYYLPIGFIPGPPAVAFEYVPPYGSLDDLKIRVTGVTPVEYVAATYIKIANGWWSRPTPAPKIPLAADGTATIDITIAAADETATEIATFLIPYSCTPPQAVGDVLPSVPCAVASTQIARTPSSISGRIADFYSSNPIAGAAISSNGIGTTKSAPDGKYSFYNLAAGGTASMTVTAPGYVFPTSPATVTIGGNQVLNFNGIPIPSVDSTTLPNGSPGLVYDVTLTAKGGVPPYNHWIVSSGALPPGVLLDEATGVIGGTPTTVAGSPFAFTVTVRDQHDTISPAQGFSISIVPAAITTTAIHSSPGASTFGKAATLTATVTPTAAAGKVTFYDGARVLGTAVLSSGTATLSEVLLNTGNRSLKARYDGAAPHGPSTSPALGHSVAARPIDTLYYAEGFDFNSAPGEILVRDLNEDGIVDIALSNASTIGAVRIFLGDGKGAFQPDASFAVGNNPGFLEWSDFNRDGKEDLIVSNFNSNNVSLLLGNGDGTFQTAVNIPVGTLPRSLKAADFNGDGKADLVVANSGSNNVSVLLGKGDGTFAPAVNLPSANQPFSLAVEDFDSDGNPDIVIANHGSGLQILMGNGDGTFHPGMNLAGGPGAPYFVSVGDLNKDGRLDIVATDNTGGNVFVFPGLGAGAFLPATVGGTGINPKSLLITDIDGDQYEDLFVVDYDGQNDNAALVLGRGDGTFFPPLTFYAFWPNSAAVGDFNGDGGEDFAISSGDIILSTVIRRIRGQITSQ